MAGLRWGARFVLGSDSGAVVWMAVAWLFYREVWAMELRHRWSPFVLALISSVALFFFLVEFLISLNSPLFFVVVSLMLWRDEAWFVPKMLVATETGLCMVESGEEGDGKVKWMVFSSVKDPSPTTSHTRPPPSPPCPLFSVVLCLVFVEGNKRKQRIGWG